MISFHISCVAAVPLSKNGEKSRSVVLMVIDSETLTFVNLLLQFLIPAKVSNIENLTCRS